MALIFMALELACKHGNLDIVRVLIDQSMKVNKLFEIAFEYERDEVMLLLINKFWCDPNIKDELGTSPL